jgi:acyl-CoA synthetase (AMP-forming)/AMP-acid ligase II
MANDSDTRASHNARMLVEFERDLGLERQPRAIKNHFWTQFVSRDWQYNKIDNLSVLLYTPCVDIGADTESRIVDLALKTKTVKQGQIGELAIRGPQVMMGYWKNPKATKEVLTEDGWLLTGDIAQEDDVVPDQAKETSLPAHIHRKGFAKRVSQAI